MRGTNVPMFSPLTPLMEKSQFVVLLKRNTNPTSSKIAKRNLSLQQNLSKRYTRLPQKNKMLRFFADLVKFSLNVTAVL